jgi:hypothetical protein
MRTTPREVGAASKSLAMLRWQTIFAASVSIGDAVSGSSLTPPA